MEVKFFDIIEEKWNRDLKIFQKIPTLFFSMKTPPIPGATVGTDVEAIATDEHKRLYPEAFKEYLKQANKEAAETAQAIPAEKQKKRNNK